MNADRTPKMPVAQTLYGEIVYWVTIVAAIICMIGPVLSMYNVEGNVLNPHYLFAAIFEGKDAHTIWNEVGGGFPGGHFYFTHRKASGKAVEVRVISGPVNYRGITALYSIIRTAEAEETVESYSFDVQTKQDQGQQMKYRQIFDLMPHAGIILDRELRVVDANSRFIQEFKYDYKEVIGQYIHLLLCPIALMWVRPLELFSHSC